MTGLCNNTRPCICRALNHIIPSTDCVCYFLCDPDRPAPESSRRWPPLVRYSCQIWAIFKTDPDFTLFMSDTPEFLKFHYGSSKTEMYKIFLIIFILLCCGSYDQCIAIATHFERKYGRQLSNVLHIYTYFLQVLLYLFYWKQPIAHNIPTHIQPYANTTPYAGNWWSYCNQNLENMYFFFVQYI